MALTNRGNLLSFLMGMCISIALSSLFISFYEHLCTMESQQQANEAASISTTGDTDTSDTPKIEDADEWEPRRVTPDAAQWDAFVAKRAAEQRGKPPRPRFLEQEVHFC